MIFQQSPDLVRSMASAGEHSALVKAPAGGIPKRLGLIPGYSTCTIWEIDSSGSLAAEPITIKVYNWFSIIACDVGERFGIAVKRKGKWKIVTWDCKDTEQLSGLLTSNPPPLDDDADQVGTGFLFSIPGDLDEP